MRQGLGTVQLLTSPPALPEKQIPPAKNEHGLCYHQQTCVPACCPAPFGFPPTNAVEMPSTAGKDDPSASSLGAITIVMGPGSPRDFSLLCASPLG